MWGVGVWYVCGARVVCGARCVKRGVRWGVACARVVCAVAPTLQTPLPPSPQAAFLESTASPLGPATTKKSKRKKKGRKPDPLAPATPPSTTDDEPIVSMGDLGAAGIFATGGAR